MTLWEDMARALETLANAEQNATQAGLPPTPLSRRQIVLRSGWDTRTDQFRVATALERLRSGGLVESGDGDSSTRRYRLSSDAYDVDRLVATLGPHMQVSPEIEMMVRRLTQPRQGDHDGWVGRAALSAYVRERLGRPAQPALVDPGPALARLHGAGLIEHRDSPSDATGEYRLQLRWAGRRMTHPEDPIDWRVVHEAEEHVVAWRAEYPDGQVERLIAGLVAAVVQGDESVAVGGWLVRAAAGDPTADGWSVAVAHAYPDGAPSGNGGAPLLVVEFRRRDDRVYMVASAIGDLPRRDSIGGRRQVTRRSRTRSPGSDSS